MFALAVVPLTLAASALANVFLTSPVASTTFTAGSSATVSWQDSGDGPTLLQFGSATFAIYVGNEFQQTPLQTIATGVNVSSTSSVSFMPDPTIGPNSGEYFIRVTSETLPNPAQPQYKEEVFSAKFTMAGMTGTFNSTLQAEIDGQSTAPIGGTASPTAASATAGTPASATGVITSSVMIGSASTAMATTGTSSPATTSATTKANGAAKPVMATGLVAFVATLVGAALL